MTLHIEDEFLLPELGCGDLGVQRGIGGQLEKSAGAPGGSMRGVEGEEGGGRAAARDQEFAAAPADPFASSVARSAARALARLSESSSGIGANSPFVVESSLMGSRRPAGSQSFRVCMPAPQLLRSPGTQAKLPPDVLNGKGGAGRLYASPIEPVEVRRTVDRCSAPPVAAAGSDERPGRARVRSQCRRRDEPPREPRSGPEDPRVPPSKAGTR